MGPKGAIIAYCPSRTYVLLRLAVDPNLASFQCCLFRGFICSAAASAKAVDAGLLVASTVGRSEAGQEDASGQ